MDSQEFEQLKATAAHGDLGAVCRQLVDRLRGQRDWHNLFDSIMLQEKFRLGLPLLRPASLQDIPDEFRKQVEAVYVEAAREAGRGFIAQGDYQSAWMYLQVIREPDLLAQALQELPDEIENYEELDRLAAIALHEGVHPEKGVRLLLKGQGICSTITALDQAIPRLTQPQRDACARLMVRHLAEDLIANVRRHVTQRRELVGDESLGALIESDPWIFEEGAYHIDVSHLGSVVRLARSIEPPADELKLAREMARYGSRLDSRLQSKGEPPFGDFYPAHVHFFNIVLNEERDAGLQYFRDLLEAEPDERDKPLLAYVLVDLLMRSDKLDEAVDVAARHLANLGDDLSITFDELCQQAGRLDVLQRVRKEQGNLVGFASALIREVQQQSNKSPAG